MANANESFAINSRRKGTVWSREKITQLIELYQQHDCLWNHYTEAYKNKEKRAKAIEVICSNLRITKMDFGKKIHNLRNQYNSEMKKLERRVEETGDDTESTTEVCRWTHFQALGFLRDVIEPRPGGYSKLRKTDSNIRFDVTSEDETDHSAKTELHNSKDLEQITQYQFEDVHTVNYNVGIAEQVPVDKSINCKGPRNENPASTLGIANKGSQILSTQQTNREIQTMCNIDEIEARIGVDNRPTQRLASVFQEKIIEETQHDHSTRCCHNSVGDVVSKKSFDNYLLPSRDQWDAFGELIATEFRHLNSDISRKKLKRKIMHAMLEVGEEDDNNFV